MTRVLATGTFDILHPGHIFYLEASKNLGQELVVIVARDCSVRYKPRPIIPETQRLRMVQALKVVDRAVLGSEFDIYEPVRAIKPDIITLGFDQYMTPDRLSRELEARGIEARVIRIMERDPHELSSTRRIVARILETRGR